MKILNRAEKLRIQAKVMREKSKKEEYDATIKLMEDKKRKLLELVENIRTGIEGELTNAIKNGKECASFNFKDLRECVSIKTCIKYPEAIKSLCDDYANQGFNVLFRYTFNINYSLERPYLCASFSLSFKDSDVAKSVIIMNPCVRV